jgi:hypothetical protein
LLAACIVSSSGQAAAVDKVACVAAAEAAQRLRKDHRLVASREQLLVCASPDCPTIVSNDCTSWLGEVERSLASVVVTARDGRGQPVSPVRVLVDGAPFVAQATTTPVELDPGDHVFRCESPSFAAAEVRVKLAEGERGRAVTCEMPSPVARPIANPAATTATAPTPGPTATDTMQAGAPRTGTGDAPATGDAGASRAGIPWQAWGLGAFGVAALGVGTFFGVSEINDQNALQRPGQCGATTHNCDTSGIQTKIDVAYVSFAAGAIALGAAVVLAIVHASSAGGSGAPAAGAAMR